MSIFKWLFEHDTRQERTVENDVNPWGEGYQAGNLRKEIHSNPYCHSTGNTYKYVSWQAGWCAARQEMENDK